VAAQPVQAEAATTAALYQYILERLRPVYLDSALPAEPAFQPTTEMFDAVLATRPRSILDFDARLRAVDVFLKLPEAASLTAANKRVANLLRKAPPDLAVTVSVERLKEPAEIKLHDEIRAVEIPVAAAIARREYTAALGRLAQLRATVDGFFEHVLVMDEDQALRANRLALLQRLAGLFGGIADFSRLPG